MKPVRRAALVLTAKKPLESPLLHAFDFLLLHLNEICRVVVLSMLSMPIYQACLFTNY